MSALAAGHAGRSPLPASELRARGDEPAHPAAAARADRADAAAAGLAEHPGDAGAGLDRADRDLVGVASRHRRAGRHGAGVPRLHDDADALGRRHGRRHLLGDRPRARRRTPRRCRRAGAARAPHQSRRWAPRPRRCSCSSAGSSTRAMGGEGASLEAALPYSNVVFAGNVLVWLMNALASVIRGTGNMLVPSLAVCVGVVAAGAALAAADLRLRPGPGARHRRRRLRRWC